MFYEPLDVFNYFCVIVLMYSICLFIKSVSKTDGKLCLLVTNDKLDGK
jgi:hypothetical protein